MKSFIADKNRKLSKLALHHVEDLSYSSLLKALRKRDVKVNGTRVSKDVTLNVGDKVDIYYTVTEPEKFEKVYLDENVLVVYKKSGYLSESVYDSVKKEFNDARFIHRLDRNTDGVMIFALNDQSENLLLKGFKERTFDKKYHALVVGVPKIKQAILTAYLLKDKENSNVKIFNQKVEGSSEIKTGYRVIEQRGETSLLEVTLYTGKTHQIRAHLSHVGYPIVGDGKYGDFKYNELHGQKVQRLTAVSIKLTFEKDSPLAYLDGKEFTVNGRD